MATAADTLPKTKGGGFLIEERWNLEPLTERDANAGDMLTAFDFSE